MTSQTTNDIEVYFNLINGQEYTYCVAGATANFKLQFQVPGTSVWMDYPGHSITASGGFADATNAKASKFHAFTNCHRIKFESQPTANYWYALSTITMPEG